MTVKVLYNLGKNSTFHGRSKHIDVRYHWIRDVLDSKLLELEKIHTNDNGSDMMIKLCQEGSLKIVAWSPGWRSPPHRREGENCWVMGLFPFLCG